MAAEAAAAAALAQAHLVLQNAAANTQLSILPSFSNNEKEDKCTATQWLQKVCLHREGAAWTDVQTVTHFRNALRNEAVNWYDTLECFGVDIANKNWEQIKTRFEEDFHAKPTPHTTIAKLSQINQKANETVNAYISRAMLILLELKKGIDPDTLPIIPLTFTGTAAEMADHTAAWTGVAEATRTQAIRHVRRQISARTSEAYDCIILTAGFRPELKSKIMAAELHTLLEIRVLAQKTELLLQERNGKSNGNGNGNGHSSNVFEMDEEVDALRNGKAIQRGRGNGRRNGYTPSRGGFQPARGGYNNSETNATQQPNPGYSRGNPNRGQSQVQRGAQRSNPNNTNQQWCDIHRTTTHATLNCYANTNRVDKPKKPVNQVEETNEPENEPEEEETANDTIKFFANDPKN